MESLSDPFLGQLGSGHDLFERGDEEGPSLVPAALVVNSSAWAPQLPPRDGLPKGIDSPIVCHSAVGILSHL